MLRVSIGIWTGNRLCIFYVRVYSIYGDWRVRREENRIRAILSSLVPTKWTSSVHSQRPFLTAPLFVSVRSCVCLLVGRGYYSRRRTILLSARLVGRVIFFSSTALKPFVDIPDLLILYKCDSSFCIANHQLYYLRSQILIANIIQL